MDKNHVASRIGHGNAISPTSLSARRRMMRAALSASMKNGMGHVFRSVMRERTNPGQIAEMRMPSRRQCPRRASAHVLTALFDAE